MNLYQGYFVPGGVDPRGKESFTHPFVSTYVEHQRRPGETRSPPVTVTVNWDVTVNINGYDNEILFDVAIMRKLRLSQLVAWNDLWSRHGFVEKVPIDVYDDNGKLLDPQHQALAPDMVNLATGFNKPNQDLGSRSSEEQYGHDRTNDYIITVARHYTIDNVETTSGNKFLYSSCYHEPNKQFRGIAAGEWVNTDSPTAVAGTFNISGRLCYGYVRVWVIYAQYSANLIAGHRSGDKGLIGYFDIMYDLVHGASPTHFYDYTKNASTYRNKFSSTPFAKRHYQSESLNHVVP
jgi:hypothetical protein